MYWFSYGRTGNVASRWCISAHREWPWLHVECCFNRIGSVSCVLLVFVCGRVLWPRHVRDAGKYWTTVRYQILCEMCVWCDVMWCDMIYDILWHDTTRHDTIGCDMIWYDMIYACEDLRRYYPINNSFCLTPLLSMHYEILQFCSTPIFSFYPRRTDQLQMCSLRCISHTITI